MKKLKTAVLVSGGGTNLQALIDRQEAGKLKYAKLSLVVSNKPGAFALERAAKAGIKGATIDKKKLGQKGFEEELKKLLKAEGIEFIVLAGFMCILTADFTREYEGRIINIHPALIPSFCGEGYYGLKVHEEALRYGVKVTGATVHYVNEIPDGGQIIIQKAVKVQDGDTPEILQRRVMEQAEWKILPRALDIAAKKLQ